MCWRNSVFGVVAGFAGVTWFYDYVGYFAKVEGGSMQPVLNPIWGNSKFEAVRADWVFLSKFAVHSFEVERGDIVTVVCPNDPKDIFIKRVVGLEGDIVRTLSYKKRYMKIPKGSCWVEGDNHKNSIDSNDFGPIPLGLIQSRAIAIVWPWDRRQFLDHGMLEELKERVTPELGPEVD